jgi:DNA-binding response OmpR family regulator
MTQILIATEDSSVADILQGEVEGEGYESVWCVSGQDAYEITSSGNAQLVLLDSAIAVFDAFATCKLLRNDPDIPATLPVILVTGVEPDYRRVESVGFSAVLPRIHTREDLRELLSIHLSGAAES